MTERDVRFSPRASEQLESLYEYIADRALPAIADRYVEQIVAVCHGLHIFSERGTPREDLFSGARSISFKRRCTIVYTIAPTMVEIAGIFYGGQDIVTAFDQL